METRQRNSQYAVLRAFRDRRALRSKCGKVSTDGVTLWAGYARVAWWENGVMHTIESPHPWVARKVHQLRGIVERGGE